MLSVSDNIRGAVELVGGRVVAGHESMLDTLQATLSCGRRNLSNHPLRRESRCINRTLCTRPAARSPKSTIEIFFQ